MSTPLRCRLGIHSWNEFKVSDITWRRRCRLCNYVEQLLITASPALGIEENWFPLEWFEGDDDEEETYGGDDAA